MKNNLVSVTFTSYFEDPFWVGIIDRVENDKQKSARIVFGKEPKDYEVYEYIRRNYYNLRFSAEVMIDKAEHIKINPKRMQRDIRRQMQKKTVGTKSQNAIKLLREEMQEERKIRKKLKKEEGKTLYRMI